MAPTTLTLESASKATWRVETSPGSGELVSVANPHESTFSEVGKYSVEATTLADGATHTFTVSAKIIRYELRDLSEEDRQIYFAALHKFYILSQKDGEALLGKGYKSLSYLVREHLYGAADVSCDHW